MYYARLNRDIASSMFALGSRSEICLKGTAFNHSFTQGIYIFSAYYMPDRILIAGDASE